MVAPVVGRELAVVLAAGFCGTVGVWLLGGHGKAGEVPGGLMAADERWLHQPASQPLPPLPPDLLEVSLEEGVDPLLVAAIVEVESGFRSAARSPRGAVGLMQVLPETASLVGVAEYADPRENLRAGCRFLRWLQEDFGSDLELVLAAYNAGPGAVYRYGGVPPFRETRVFIERVREAYARLAGKPTEGLTPF
jgi:soluble lytic murein transglycosylase-like protein